MRTKGNCRGQPFFHVEAFNKTLAYLSGKGTSNRRHTSGKGIGRRMNPTRRDCLVMTCRVCNYPEHFEARCPQSRNTSAPPQLFTQTVEGPLADILGHTNHGVTNYPISSANPVPVIEGPPEERTLSSWYGTEFPTNQPRTIRSGSKNLIRGKELHEPSLSHHLKNIQGLHPKRKLFQNRNVLPGQIGQLMSKNLVLNHQTLAGYLKQASRKALEIRRNRHDCGSD